VASTNNALLAPLCSDPNLFAGSEAPARGYFFGVQLKGFGNADRSLKCGKKYVLPLENTLIKGDINLEKIFKIEFTEDIRRFMDRKDGILSIIFYIYHMAITALFGMLVFKSEIPNIGESYFQFQFYMLSSITIIVPIFIILKVRGQKLNSVGIKKEKIMKSIFLGVIGSIPFSILNIIEPISSGKVLNTNITEVLWIFLNLLIHISLVEELVYRGFIQTRIQGLIRNKWLNIMVVGIMFGLMHIPFQMMVANMTVIDFIVYDLVHLIITTLMHIYLVYLYTRYDNILAPVIAHAIINFSYSIFI